MPRQRHSILPASCIADVSTASTSIHSGDSHWHSFFFSSPSNYITRLRASRGGFFFHYLSYTSTHFHPLFFVRSFSFALSHYTFIFNVLCSCTCTFIFLPYPRLPSKICLHDLYVDLWVRIAPVSHSVQATWGVAASRELQLWLDAH